MNLTGAPWPLIGRADELALVESARTQRRAGVVIRGPAGSGKSRLAHEVLDRAERDGSFVVRVLATRSAASVALGAFTDAIPAQARSDDPFTLLQRSAAALRAQAGRRQLVVGVDDAHLLDLVSATLVLHMATSGGAFVIAVAGTDGQCPDAIVSLWKDAGARRVDLGLLDEADTARLVQAILGAPLERAAQYSIFLMSGGNALYVRELILMAQAAGKLELARGLYQLRGNLSVSPSLRELVEEALGGLDEAEHNVVALLALGEPLRLSELVEMAGLSAVTAVETRGLIHLDGTSSDSRVNLAHPLYSEVTRSGLATLRARQLRLELLATFAARRTLTPEETLRTVRWRIETDQELPGEMLLTAAHTANLSGDAAFGAELAQQAQVEGAGVEAALLLGRAHLMRRRYDDAAAVLDTVDPHLCTQQQAVEYLQQQSEVLHWGQQRPDALRDLLEDAKQWWNEPSWSRRLEPLWQRLTSFEQLGALTPQPLTSSDPVGPPALSTDAPAVDEGNSADVALKVTPTQVANLFYGGHTAAARQLARSIRPTPPLRDLDEVIALGLWSRITLETGVDWAGLEKWMNTALGDGVRLGDPAAAGQAAYSLAALSLAAGRYRDTKAFLAEAERQLEYRDPIGILPVVIAMQVTAAHFTGDHSGVEAALARCHNTLGAAGPLAHQLPYIARAQAWAQYDRGERAAAQRTLLDVAQQLAASPVHTARMTYEAMRAGAAARNVAGTLKEARQQCDAPLVAVYVEHAQARANDDGPALLAVAESMHNIGAHRYAAEAAAHAADAFARQGRQDSARRATARSRALHPARQDGIPPEITEVDQSAIALSEREAQLVEFAARGMTNAQIAQQLVLSIRTVETHLYRAMNKLGISKRSDLRPQSAAADR